MSMKKLHQRLISMLIPASALLLLNPAHAENLKDVYQLAMENAPELRAALASKAAVNESVNQTNALNRPNVNFNAGLQYSVDDVDSAAGFKSYDYATQNYSLDLRQPLYRYDYTVQKRQSSILAEQAEAQYKVAQQALALDVAQRYFDTLAAQDSLAFAQAEKEAIKRQLEQTKQRFEVGLIAITDVHESQAAYDMAVASEIGAQVQQSVAQEALHEIIGQDLSSPLAGLGEKMKLIPPTPNDQKQWIATAQEKSYQLSASQAAVRHAQQQLEQHRTQRRPTVDLVASYGYRDSGGFFGKQQSTSSSVGVQLNVPLYQGGAISSRVRQAQHQLNQAKENLEQQRRAVKRNASDAFLHVQANISRVNALEQAVLSSKSALAATEAGYDVGTRTTVDVLDVRRNLFRAQRDFARARYDYIISTLRLKQASGLLNAEDIQLINAWLR